MWWSSNRRDPCCRQPNSCFCCYTIGAADRDVDIDAGEALAGADTCTNIGVDAIIAADVGAGADRSVLAGTYTDAVGPTDIEAAAFAAEPEPASNAANGITDTAQST